MYDGDGEVARGVLARPRQTAAVVPVDIGRRVEDVRHVSQECHDWIARSVSV
jgi:hypothetical protein